MKCEFYDGKNEAGAPVPYFRMDNERVEGRTVFDGPATEVHKRSYAVEWKAYQAAKAPPASPSPTRRR